MPTRHPSFIGLTVFSLGLAAGCAGDPGAGDGSMFGPGGGADGADGADGESEGASGETDQDPEGSSWPDPAEEPTGGVPPAHADTPFNCPPAEAPAYTLGGAAQRLSDQFASSCAGCHGPDGTGLANAPSLRGTLDFAAFRAVIRDGKGAMPAFDDAFISDAELQSDFEALQGDPGELPVGGSAWDWSEEELEQALTEGLAAWRTPDAHGVACTNCHAPDALDLAFLAYEDDAILRRAALHVEPDDAASIVRFVHAQRRVNDLQQPCDRMWRPFQPGGVPLAGDTPEQQDQAFGEQLFEMGMLITGRVETLADAHGVVEQMLATNLRTLPIGINLPRWTEDRFNGDAHASVNDYLAPLGTPPNDPDAWYARVDEYLADPSDENLVVLLAALDEETHDAGYAEQHEGSGACAMPSYMDNLNLRKRKSVLIAQHMFRKATRGEDGWLHTSSMPFQPQAEVYQDELNPFFDLGGAHIEPICYHDYDGQTKLLETFPEGMMGELPEPERYDDDVPYARNVMVGLHQTLAHPWMTLGQIYEPTLHLGRNHASAHNKVHYWHTRNFSHHTAFHEPFMSLHRILSQEDFFRRNGQSEDYPERLELRRAFVTHPLLDGSYNFLSEPMRSFSASMAEDDPRWPTSTRVRLNVIRTILLLQRELLLEGASVHAYQDGQGNRTLSRQISAYRDYVQRFIGALDEADGPIARELGEDAAIYTDALLALIDEVDGLMASAPEAAG